MANEIDVHQAWNNFVLNSQPSAYDHGSRKWAAALAKMYMNLVNNGGVNAFLTATHDVSSDDVLKALTAVGAQAAAQQLQAVLSRLGETLPSASQDERWSKLEELWTDNLEELDMLSAQAEAGLVDVLAAHVAAEEEFYRGLASSD